MFNPVDGDFHTLHNAFLGPSPNMYMNNMLLSYIPAQCTSLRIIVTETTPATCPKEFSGMSVQIQHRNTDHWLNSNNYLAMANWQFQSVNTGDVQIFFQIKN